MKIDIKISIKLFAHAAAVILILLNNDLRDKPYLISLMLIILFASYFRQFYLNAYDRPERYKWVCTAVELFAIIGIGFLDKSNIYLFFFFVCMCETVLYYESKYSGVFLIVPFLLSRYLIDVLTKNYSGVNNLLIDIFLVFGVPIAFIAVMSYSLKSQMNERAKLARINGELEDAYKKLIDAASAQEQLSIEKERVRMAREIHDTLAHTLTTLIIQLEACKKLSSVDIGRLNKELEKAQELTREGLNDVKRTIKSLRPQALEGKPFFESILDFINSTMKNAEVHIILDNDLPGELKLPAALEVAIFRLIQESVTNSIRHGRPKEIHITMKLDAGKLQVNIHDDGAGCSRIKKGFGLTGIQERVEAAGGHVYFSSAAGSGFTSSVSIPIEEGGV